MIDEKKIKTISEKCIDAFRDAEDELMKKTTLICKDLTAEQTEQMLDFLPDKKKGGIKFSDVECILMLDEILREIKTW